LWRDRVFVKKPRFALVFRGTDVTKWGDWYSNVRWLTRLNPTTWDQYGQTRDLIRHLIPELDRKYGKDYELIAIGHSLGGGLAQHAAYTTPRIRAVYAFATSPVTAVTSIDPRVDKKYREGLSIYRTYEAGEILSGLRWTSRRILGLQTRDPKITELRFNFRTTFRAGSIGGGPLGQHSIRQLACDLICRVDLDGDDARCKKPLLPAR
jgi:pimeloyl-ACP methyl ester carboxylesterase